MATGDEREMTHLHKNPGESQTDGSSSKRKSFLRSSSIKNQQPDAKHVSTKLKGLSGFVVRHLRIRIER